MDSQESLRNQKPGLEQALRCLAWFTLPWEASTQSLALLRLWRSTDWRDEDVCLLWGDGKGDGLVRLQAVTGSGKMCGYAADRRWQRPTPYILVLSGRAGGTDGGHGIDSGPCPGTSVSLGLMMCLAFFPAFQRGEIKHRGVDLSQKSNTLCYLPTKGPQEVKFGAFRLAVGGEIC